MELTIGVDGLEHNGAAGQYSELMVKQVGTSRSYSFAKAPQNENPNELSFFVRNVPKGRFSKWLFDKDPTGQKLEVKTPFGSFYYRDGKGPMVCIAGGSGMSAVKAVLEQAAIDQVERDAIYLFGARTQEDIYSKPELEAIQKKWNPNFKFEFVYVLNMEPEESDWTGPRGMVTDFLKSDYIEKGKLNMKECQGYLCGPPPMIDAAIKEFTSEGMPNEEIFFDKFLDSGSK
jgi:NAD(P)H-flavin reductase